MRDRIEDRRAKVLSMSMAGDTAEAIAAALGVTRRTVERDRAAMQIVLPVRPCRGGRYSQGCRCDLCRKRSTEIHQRWRAKNSSADPASFKHGRSAYANYGCRCDVCRAGHRELMREQYQRRVDLQKAAQP